MVFSHPKVGELKPEQLAGCGALRAFWWWVEWGFQGVPAAKASILTGGRLLSAAINATDCVLPVYAAQADKLLQWFASEIVEKRWGVTDAWKPCKEDGYLHPLSRAAGYGLTGLIALALSKGAGTWINESLPKGEGPPIVSAFINYHKETFRLLLEQGIDPHARYGGWTIIHILVNHFCFNYVEDVESPELPTEAEREVCREMTALLLAKHPHVVNHAIARTDAPGRAFGVLEKAIFTRDFKLVELLLKAGAPVRKSPAPVMVGGKRLRLHTSIEIAVKSGNVQILEVLIKKYKVMDGWQDLLDDGARDELTISIAYLAAACYGGKRPDFPMRSLDLVLETGYKHSFDLSTGRNPVVQSLVFPDPINPTSRYAASPANALKALRRFHAAGWNVHQMDYQMAKKHGENAYNLLHTCAALGYEQIVDFLVKEVGVNIDTVAVMEVPGEPGDASNDTPLLLAVGKGHRALALRMLREYKAKPVIKGLPTSKQTPNVLLSAQTGYTDAAAAEILKAMIENDPSLLELDCYQDPKSSTTLRRQAFAFQSPIPLAIQGKKPKCLELLLTSGLPGAKQMAESPFLLPNPGGRASFFFFPAQVALITKSFDCLSLLLAHSDTTVTETLTSEIPSVLGLCPDPRYSVPRHIVAAVQAKATAQQAAQEQARAERAVAAAHEGATTNTFEETEATSLGVLASAEGKRKTGGKKASKKKGKGKKKAAKKSGGSSAGAGAGSGSGSGAGDDNDDSSDDDDDEEGLNEDERMFGSGPSADALREQLARASLGSSSSEAAAGAGAGAGSGFGAGGSAPAAWGEGGGAWRE